MIATPWKTAGKVAAYVVPVLLAAGYILWLHLRISGLEAEVAARESDLAKQNASIEQWRQLADTRQEAAQDAIERAQEQTRRSQQLLTEIEDSEAQTCEQGIELIDRALGL